MDKKQEQAERPVTAILPKRIKAAYIGKMAEHGYTPNKEYVIYLKSNTVWKIDGTARVEYPSIERFLDDWNIIKINEFKKKETDDTV